MAVRLETERLVLKSFESSDARLFYDFLMRNYDFFKPWSPEYGLTYRDFNFHIAMVEQHERNAEEGTGIKFGLYKKGSENNMIGTCAISNIVKGPFQSCFLGYRIDEAENNKGFATEAIKRVARYAFDELKLHRIEANIIPGNKASIRAVEKAGFVYEGLSKKYLKINGVWEDHLHYVMLNENTP